MSEIHWASALTVHSGIGETWQEGLTCCGVRPGPKWKRADTAQVNCGSCLRRDGARNAGDVLNTWVPQPLVVWLRELRRTSKVPTSQRVVEGLRLLRQRIAEVGDTQAEESER